jgi:uncharacterized RDD family membrane protein YckC
MRGARDVGKATGIDQAIELAAEEAMVAAVESEAVERAIARVLKGPVVEEAVHGALESDAVKRALIEALDSELVDEVWLRLLASDETQCLVERIAEAPEIRAAISAQSVGFVEDIGHTVGDATHRIDDALERVVRRVLRRPQRPEPTPCAGAVTRALALGLDALLVNLAFSGLAAVAAIIASAFNGGNGVSDLALVFGSGAWLVLGGLYLIGFWSLAGQTLGMRFLGIRLAVAGQGLPARRSIRRLIGLGLGAITFGIGYLGILFNERRRGWQDRMAGVDVVYEPRDQAPWSRLEVGDPGTVPAPDMTKAPDPRGLRPQQAAGS